MFYFNFKQMTKTSNTLFALLFILTTTVYAQDAKTETIKEKSIELTDYLYSKMENLHPESREYLELDAQDYLTDLIALLRKDLDRSSTKYKTQLEYLNHTFYKNISESRVGRNLNKRGRNANGKKKESNESFRSELKGKILELIKDLDLEIPKWERRKKK